MKLELDVPEGHVLKVLNRKGNTSKIITITVNQDTEVMPRPRPKEPRRDPSFSTTDLSAEARRIWGPSWNEDEKAYEFGYNREFRLKTGAGIYGPAPEPPVNCVLSEWSEWVPTSGWSDSGNGEEVRAEQRTCTVLTAPAFGGRECGPRLEIRLVSRPSETQPVDCVLSDWGAWVPTSAWGACVDSLQTRTEQRTRTVVTQPANGGTACEALTESRDVTQACVADVPPAVDCVLSAWGAWVPTGNWSACVADLQTRTEQRSRTVVTQPSEGGAACGVLTESREVSQACVSPVDCVLSEWGPWVAIDNWSACVGGFQTRNEGRIRSVITQPTPDGAVCGVLEETRVATQTCTLPTSPSGTRGDTYIDNEGAVWTLDSSGSTLRNAVKFPDNINTGWAWRYLWLNGIGYHQGPPPGTQHWYSWSGTTWTDLGTTDPETPLPPPLPPPPPAPGALQNLATTGSMQANSFWLTNMPTAAYNSLSVGQWLGVVPAAGLFRGSESIGGAFPSTGFNTLQEMWAANTLPLGTRAFVRQDSYKTYIRTTSGYNGWSQMLTYLGVFSTWHYGVAQPLALNAQILEKSGGNIRLSQMAQIAVTGANVYLNVIPTLNQLIVDEPGNGLLVPAGYYMSGVVSIDRSNFTLEGIKADTTFQSIPGMPGVVINVKTGRTGVKVQHFKLKGNWQDNGLGINAVGATAAWAPGNQPTPEWTGGVSFEPNTVDGEVNDIEFTNVCAYAAYGFFSTNLWVRDCQCIKTTLDHDYIQRQVLHSDSSGGGVERCTLNSTYLTHWLETFKSTGQTYNDNTSTNGINSTNGSGNHNWNRNTQNFTAGSRVAGTYNAAVGVAMEIGINIGVGYSAQGGNVLDHTIATVATDAGGYNMRGVNVNANTPKIIINRLAYTASAVGQAVNALGPHTVMRNSTAVCTVNPQLLVFYGQNSVPPNWPGANWPSACGNNTVNGVGMSGTTNPSNSQGYFGGNYDVP